MKRVRRLIGIFLIVLLSVIMIKHINKPKVEETDSLKVVEENENKSETIQNEPVAQSAEEDGQEVKMSIMQKPVVDIVLAKSKTRADVDNFKEELFKQLQNLNIDTEYVNVVASEMVLVENTTSFQWNEDVSSSIGSITRQNNGADVTMKGNNSKEGKNAIWIMPEKDQEQKFSFHYDIDFGDSFKAAGMLLRVKEEGNKLTGYALSFNESGHDYYSGSGNKNGALWKFTYTKNDHSKPMQKTKVAGIDIDKTGDLTVVASDTQITVTGGGLSEPYVYEIPLDDQTIGNGYGFFTDHYSHGCEDIGHFELTGINLQTEDIKSYTEVLKEPEWRDNAYKFIVDVDDTQNEELLDKSRYAEILSRLLDDTIYFVSWGVGLNEEEFEGLIKDNDTHGSFFTNTDGNLYQETAEYIKEVIGEPENTQYVIVGEPIDITITPDNIQTGTADDQWPFGKWKVNHDYQYYENNMGQFAKSGQYLSDFINVFDKVGDFKITFRDQNIIPTDVYVHRRPVAVLDMQVDGTTVTLDGSQSYDLDKQSEANNGIAQYEWRYFCVEDGTWHDGQLTTIDASKHYVVQLRVQDLQGAWSAAQTANIGTGIPVARFDITTDPITKYDEDVQYVDSSYDPEGKQLQTYLWEVYKEDGTTQLYTGSTPKTDFTDLVEGKYKVYLTVTTEDGRTSERYGRTIEVTGDKIAPEFVVDPIECDWTKSIDVNVEFTDKGGSGFNSYQYAVTESQDVPSSYGNWISNENDTITINNTTGEKYLHIVAKDNAGNVSTDRVVCIYKLDNTNPNISFSIDPETITTGTVEITISPTDEHSGVKKVYFENQEIQPDEHGAYKVTVDKNKRDYNVRVEDAVGNSTTKTVDITNIYKECHAGLGHPNFSSDYDECPICELIKNMQVTKITDVYNDQDQRVEYTNPQSATIVEYYDGQKAPLPHAKGEYAYELKVVYEGQEYKTGLTGTYTITAKPINITDIQATDREYNKTNVVDISGGNLVGVEPGDNVGFNLPATGTTDSEKVGHYNVTIGEITLTGDDASNYTLIQPNKEDVDVEITQKTITIENIEAEDREYDKTNVVNISGGNLVGVEPGDNVGFNLPATGTTDDVIVGDYKVSIDEITLTGDDASNYKLTQPSKEDVDVTITRRKVKVEDLHGVTKKYDKNNVLELEGTTLDRKIDGDDVKAVIPKTGVSESNDVGNWRIELDDVVLEGTDAFNYEIVQPEYGEVMGEIIRPDSPEMNINSYVSEINGKGLNDEENEEGLEGQALEQEKDEVEIPQVRYGDIVTIKMDIKNEGTGAGYIEKVKVKLPEGLEYIEDDEDNEENEWKQNKKVFETSKYEFDNGVENELQTGEERTLEIKVKVTQEEMIEENLVVNTEVEQTDIRKEQITYPEDSKANKSDVEIYLAYTDFVAGVKVKEIVNEETGEKVDFEVDNDVIKFDTPEDKVANTKLKVVYEVNIANEGKTKGKLDTVVSYLPEGLEFRQNENADWKVENNTNIVTTDKFNEVEAKESATKEIVLHWNLNDNVGTKENEVMLLASDDIDQRKIAEKPSEEMTLEEADYKEIAKTNNVADVTIIGSVSTGTDDINYLLYLVPVALLGIFAITVIISKKSNTKNSKI